MKRAPQDRGRPGDPPDVSGRGYRLREALRQRLVPLCGRLHAVSARDRLAIWLAGAAIVVGVELAAVGPMRDKAALVAAAEASQLQDVQAQQLEREAQLSAEREALQTRLAHARERIEANGIVHRRAVSVEDATAVLFRASRVRVLRVQTGVRAQPLARADSTTEPGDLSSGAAIDGGSATAAAATLYAHRVVVDVAGPPEAVLQAARALQSASLPWRLLRIEWRRHRTGEVVATCTLGVDSTSATWLRV